MKPQHARGKLYRVLLPLWLEEKTTHTEAWVLAGPMFFPKLAAAGGGEVQRGSLRGEPSQFPGMDMDRTLLWIQVLWDQILSFLGNVSPPSALQSPRWKNRLENSELTLSHLEVLMC